MFNTGIIYISKMKTFLIIIMLNINIIARILKIKYKYYSKQEY